jgi:hypothetical protein
MPVVPSLASSVPSIIANSSPTNHPIITRSRSDADGEEPTVSPPVVSPVLLSNDDTNRTAIRQPADGLGNPNTTAWRTSDNNSNTNQERRVLSWSDDDEDDVVPPSSRLRPVLIGGEDNTPNHHSDDNDETILTNLSLNT